MIGLDNVGYEKEAQKEHCQAQDVIQQVAGALFSKERSRNSKVPPMPPRLPRYSPLPLAPKSGRWFAISVCHWWDNSWRRNRCEFIRVDGNLNLCGSGMPRCVRHGNK